MGISRFLVASILSSVSRFMHVPRPVLEKQLKTEEKELADDISSLNKKVRLRKLID